MPARPAVSPRGGSKLAAWAAIRIGCAGWALRKEDADAFPPPGTHLARYAARFNAVEINSSFYRPHRRTTYERWAASVPRDFAFAVKIPKAITHTLRLECSEAALDEFLAEVSGLGAKVGPLLLQLPPSLELSLPTARTFFAQLRQRFAGSVVCEPRHASWFAKRGENLLRKFAIARAAVDPPLVSAAGDPGGDDRLRYYRLHGSPRTYYSAYDSRRLSEMAGWLQRDKRDGCEVWCIFDNTAAGAATANALELQAMVRP